MSATPKKSNVVIIVLAILGGGVVLVGIVIVVAIYLVWSSPEGRGIVGMMGEAVKISAKAQKAPGTKELRKMGCQQAMVMDADDFAKMMSHLDAGRPTGNPSFGEMVTCSGSLFGTPPTCDDVAAKYVSVVGQRSKPFVVNVQQAGKQCTQLYDGAGQRKAGVGDPPPPMPMPAPAQTPPEE